MQPHESQCMFRPIVCLIPNCGEEVPYKSLLSHLTYNHKICGSDLLPASITFHADQPITNNRKWLPFAIQAFGNVFYVMMEVIRPHFWVWVWLQTTKIEDSYESLFITQIMIKNVEKKLRLMWEGPVQSLRTSEKVVMRDGLCFVAHEVFLQHFNSGGYFTFCVDIKKSSRTTVMDLNANVVDERTSAMNTPTHASLTTRSRINSDHSLYDSGILREQERIMEDDENIPNNNLEELADHPNTDSFVSKLSN
ncbi:uncharacterized protein LOC110847002 [Folsomia candida]|nr:uncharacterized protein LOC110847002 [Folsomia candida]